MKLQNKILVGLLTSGLTLVAPAARGPNANDGFPLGSSDTMRTVAVPSGGKALQGDDATARLKEQGHYESLMQAVQAARYAVETSMPRRTPPQPASAMPAIRPRPCAAGSAPTGWNCSRPK